MGQIVQVRLGTEIAKAEVLDRYCCQDQVVYKLGLGVVEFPSLELIQNPSNDPWHSGIVFEAQHYGHKIIGDVVFHVVRDNLTWTGLLAYVPDIPEGDLVRCESEINITKEPLRFSELGEPFYTYIGGRLTTSPGCFAADKLLLRPRSLISSVARGLQHPERLWNDGEFAVRECGKGLEFVRLFSGSPSTNIWHPWDYSFEVCHVTHNGRVGISLDADRQEWLFDGQIVQPQIDFGLLKGGSLRFEAFHPRFRAGDRINIQDRRGRDVSCFVRRATILPAKSHRQITYDAGQQIVATNLDLIDEEGKTYRAEDDSIYGPAEAFDHANGMIVANQTVAQQQGRWYSETQNVPRPADVAIRVN